MGKADEENNQSALESYQNMTITAEQIIENYLEDEQHLCDIWSNYVNRSAEAGTPMTAEEAINYIRKPFVPAVLTLRVRHLLDLIRLKNNLHSEVIRKIGVPSAVINKPGRLTDEEFELIKSHPLRGAKILANISEKPELVKGARWHHERYDGTGYPDGLVGEDIPEEARIIAVADAYDAMTSNRSYRSQMLQSAVAAVFEKCKGTQFDPRFAAIML